MTLLNINKKIVFDASKILCSLLCEIGFLTSQELARPMDMDLDGGSTFHHKLALILQYDFLGYRCFHSH